MKKFLSFHILFVALFLICIASTNAQSYWTFGGHGAFPQNELKKSGYDNGGGVHLGIMGRMRPATSTGIYNFQWGVFTDASWLSHKNFGVMINTPVPDNGKVRINNYSLSFYGVLRNAWDFDKYMLYADFVFGPRGYFTNQTITAENPNLNPDYESLTTNRDVVHTTRFQKGIAAGFLYKLSPHVYADFGFTYAMGPKGLVQPLKDVFQEGNEIRYKPKRADTDILLIRAGFVFKIQLNSSGPSNYSPTPQQNNNTKTRTTSPRPSSPAPVKKKIEIKPNSKPSNNKDN